METNNPNDTFTTNGKGITNPMPNGTKRVEADLDKDCFDYFFKKLFAGERGPRQAFICTFFKRFHEACINEGIQPVWDETNEPRVAAILNRLNFRDVADECAQSFCAGQTVGKAESVKPREPKPSRTRRPTSPPSINTTQSDAQRNVGGSTS